MNKILYIFGPSAAGKSTVVDLLVRQLPDIQVVDFDVIKRRIAGYDWQRHAQAGREMTLDKLDEAEKGGGPILLLFPSPKDEEEFDRVHSIAVRHQYVLVNVEITAPAEVLIQRYTDRLHNHDPAKKGWKFKTLDEFKLKLQEPYYRPDDTVRFDSSLQRPGQIASQIIGRMH